MFNPSAKIKNTFRSLSDRNYRLFFTGHGVSRVGLHMQRVALGWLVYELTGSSLMLGLVAFSREIGIAVLAPAAGLAGDRLDRRKSLVFCQVLLILQALSLAALVFLEIITVRHIVFLSIMHGAIAAFEIPIRQAFIIEVVPGKKDLNNAIGLNSTVFHGAMLVGPAVAGFVIAAYGEAACFFLTAASYAVMIPVLLLIRPVRLPGNPRGKRALAELKEGFSYAFGFVPIRYILLLVGIISLVALPFMTLMPVFAGEVLKGGPRTLGFLMGAAGLGAFTGALFLASRKNVRGLGTAIARCVLLLGASLVAFSLSRNLWLSMGLIFFAGFGAMIERTAANVVLQTIVDDDKRGRVMSFFVVALVSTLAIGDLAAGAVAEIIGAPNMVLAGGVVCMAASAGIYMKLPYIRKHVHPVYREQGIMPGSEPEVA